MINVGVIGAGAAALTAHLPALLSSGRFRLVGVCDLNPSRLDEALARFPTQGFATSQELLEVAELEAVVVATPPQSHAALATEALRLGRHVLCEKPLARTRDECRALVDLAADVGAVLAVGHEKRFHPSLLRVRELIRGGDLGTVFFAGVHWGSAAKLEPDRLIPEGFAHGYEWRWRNRDVGGGLVQDHLPHYVDLVRFWTDQEPVRIQAHTANVARDLLHWSPEDSVWEDFGLCVVRFSGGLVLRFETSVVGRSISPIWSLGSGLGEWTEYGYLLGSEALSSHAIATMVQVAGYSGEKSRRLLVLGAGPAQLGLLEAARAHGIWTAVCDRDPAAPGFAFADRRCIVSTEDEPAIERLAAALALDGVIAPGTNRPVAVAARVAEKLGLPHPISPATAMVATNKLRQREALAAAGVPQPRWQVVTEGESELEVALPVVVKAPDRVGQRGLSVVLERSELAAAIATARAASRGGAVLVEEYLDGPEVTVSGFSAAGEFVPLAVTDRISAEVPAFGVPLAQFWPSPHAEAAAEVDAPGRRGARDRGRPLVHPAAREPRRARGDRGRGPARRRPRRRSSSRS